MNPITDVDDDSRLMLAFQDGDESAFAALLERYESRIVNFTFRCTGNIADAEDLAHGTFLRIFRAAERYEPRAKFSTWVYRIAANLCHDFRKKKRGDVLAYAAPVSVRICPDDDREQERASSSEKSVEVSVEEQHARHTLRMFLDELPENQRFALTLKVYEDKSYEEIAAIMDCSVSAVESLLFRARQSLKKSLQEGV